MPFTFSHPAIILPLLYLPKRWISLTGLIIGSLTPDFEYFIRMKIQSDYSHTISGLFWFDLPLGLLLAFIFHGIVRNSLIDNLPVFLKKRFVPFINFDWSKYFFKNWIIVLISLLIGAASHLFWDAFTHNHGFFVDRFSLLNNHVDLILFEVPFFKVLQHASTIIGAIAIGFVILKLSSFPTRKGKNLLYYWLIFSLTVSLILTYKIITGLKFNQYGNFITTVIAAKLLSLILTPIILKRITPLKK